MFVRACDVWWPQKCDMVIEAVIEDIPLKQRIFAGKHVFATQWDHTVPCSSSAQSGVRGTPAALRHACSTAARLLKSLRAARR